MIEPNYQALFRRYATGICFKPDQMIIREVRPSSEHVALMVRVHGDDIGLLCGRQGGTIQALQHLFKLMGQQHRRYIRISIDKTCERKNTATVFNVIETWDKTPETIDLLTETITAMGFEPPAFEIEEQHDTTLLTMKSPKIDPAICDSLAHVIRAWGKSQGRHIFLLQPHQITTSQK